MVAGSLWGLLQIEFTRVVEAHVGPNAGRRKPGPQARGRSPGRQAEHVLLVRGELAGAKLLDFGIVRLKLSGLAQTSPPLTGTGIVVGTVGTISIEASERSSRRAIRMMRTA